MSRRSMLFGLAIVLLGAPLAAGQEEKAVHKVYDVGFLTQAQEDFPGGSLARGPSAVPGPMAVEEESYFTTAEDLTEAIRSNFHEDSWADASHSLESESGRLYVVNTPAVHEVIARYLAAMRAQRGTQIAVEATLVEFSPAALDALESAGTGAGAALDEKQRAALAAALEQPAEARVLHTSRVTAFSGQRAHARSARMRTYLYDYDIQIAEKAVSADPITGRFEEGALFDVRPSLDFTGTRVTLEVRYEQQALAAALTAFDARLANVGPIHLPVLGRAVIRTCVAAAPEQTVLAATVSLTPLAGERRCVALLLRASVIRVVAAPAQPVESAEKRHFRAFDVGFLTRFVPDFPGPSLEPAPMDGASAAGPSFMFEESVDAGLTISVGQLVELVKRNVAAESWNNARNRLWANGGQLLVVQTPEVLKELEGYLAALAQEHGRLIRVESIALAGPGLRGALAQGSAVSAETIRTLKSGTTAKVLAQASTWCFHRERVHAAGLVTRNYISGLDSQIATDSRGMDPVIGQIEEGFLLDVRPTLVGDGTSILLDLRPALARMEQEPQPIETRGDDNRMHLVDLELTEQRLNLTVRDGEWTVATLAGDRAILVRAHAAKTP